MQYGLLLIAILLACLANARQSDFLHEGQGLDVEMYFAEQGLDQKELDLLLDGSNENPRAMAIVLDILLGPFGGHRLYLGTKPHVPVVYTLTLGGGLGILPLIDLFHLAFTKDLDVYRNNGKIFMWSQGKTTPP